MGINAGETIIGFIGRITKDKGVSELVQAISSVNKTYGNVRLVIIGPDEGGIDYLGDLLQNGAVTYMGPTTNVRSAYWAFDAFALPSYREGFPVSPLEAQSCGLPSVTTMATGCIDSQPPSNSRLTVPTKDPDSLAAVIEFLVANPGERSSMGKNARQWVSENFKSSDVVQRQIQFLQSKMLR
jgi:glycosyltransferase involved in cell wall biosynthesis